MKARLVNVPSLTPAVALLLTTACGGGGTPTMPPPPAATYSVGGYVAGLNGSGLSLSYNGGTAVGISRNGAFTSVTDAATGSTYSVTIVSQPTNPAQTCTVNNGSGTVGTANVTSISVYCPQAIGAWAYVATQGTITLNPGVPSIPGSLSAYAINPNTGALSLVVGSTVTTGPAVGWLALVSHSSSLWALSFGNEAADDDNTVSSLYAYTVNANSGLLAANAGNPLFTLDGTSSTPPNCSNPQALGGITTTAAVTFAPSGTFGYTLGAVNLAAENFGSWMFTVTSGVPAPLGAAFPNICLAPIAIDPSGQFAYYVTEQQPGNTNALELAAATVNSATGALTLVPGSGPVVGPGVMLTFDPFGRFGYLLDGGLIYAFAIDPSSGALAAIPGNPFSFPGDALSMSIAPDGQYAYILATDGLYTYSIDASTGALSGVGAPLPLQINDDHPCCQLLTVMEIEPSGQFLYLSASVGASQWGIYVYALDASTGEPTLVPGSPFALTTQSVPLAVAVVN